MLTEDINYITLALRAVQQGDKETAASYIYRARSDSNNRHIKRLADAVTDLHSLTPYVQQAIKERKKQQEFISVSASI
jgi:predicted deacylase